MADFSTLIATLQATIKTNYNQEITGQILQDDLLAIVDAVNRLKQDTLEGYAFHGAPLADGDSVSVTQNTFFLVGKGTYTINGTTETTGEGISALVYDSVDDEVRNYPLFVYDTTPTQNSGNAITSGAVKTALDLKADKSTTYTKSETDNLLNGKVDKEAGKGLSTNDYTDAEKTKLGALPTAAELSTDLAAKQDKDTDAVAGNVAVMDAGGNSVDGGVALADLATKAEVEAVEQEVAQIAGEAGLAEAVIDTDGAGTEQEFTFRKSGGDGGAYYRKIKGKTLAWNQLVNQFAIPVISGDSAHLTATKEVDGRIKIVLSAPVSRLTQITFANPITAFYKAEHRYFLSLRQSDNLTPYLTYSGGNGVWWQQTPSSLATLSTIWSVTTITDAIFTIYVGATLPAGTYYIYPQVVDLTLAGLDEVSTVADFDALYPNPLPYNSGTLISNDAEAVETTGANQWDEEWESGVYSDGRKIADTNRIRCKNPIPCFPSTMYKVAVVGEKSNTTFDFNFLDDNGNFISNLQVTNDAFETPGNCHYFVFCTLTSYYGTTYNHDTCINLSNPAINGQYFPYWKRTLQLGITTRKDTDGNVPFPNGLQSCPVAQDEATMEGGTIRVGTRAYQAGDESDADVITDGTNTNYALTTPVPFTWKEPLNLGVKVDENGTERAVAPEGATAPSAPFVADTTYTMSVARMVEKLQNL